MRFNFTCLNRPTHSSFRLPALKPSPRIRLSFLLVATAVALLSTGAVASVIANNEAISSPDQDLSSQVEHRHLRVHKRRSEDQEERGFNMQKFNQLMTDRNYRSRRFGNWVTKKYTDRDIYNKLQVESYPNYKRIFNYYQTYLENFAPRLISK